MSWDAVLLRIKGALRPIDEVDDEDYLPLGKRKDVLAAITETFPTARRETPTQLIYQDGDLSIEFVPQGRNPIDSWPRGTGGRCSTRPLRSSSILTTRRTKGTAAIASS